MKKSSNTLLWILSLIIIAAAAFWFGTAQVTAPQERVEKPTTTQEVAANTTPNPETLIPEEETGNLLYRNEKYHFVLQLPPRWKDYKIEEEVIPTGGNSYNFQLKLKTGEYHDVFNLSVISSEVWEKSQTDEGPHNAQYLLKKDDNVFIYQTGHDDDGFAGFPEIIPELTYKGPYFDVINIIIPSFAFTE